MAAINATLAVTEADDTVSSVSSSTPAAGKTGPGGRFRRIAYDARLDLAIRARAPTLFRAQQRARPEVLTEIARSERVATQVQHFDTTSYGQQVSYEVYPAIDPSAFVIGLRF